MLDIRKGHEHEWAVRAAHVSFTLNCRTSPSTSRIAAWCHKLTFSFVIYLPPVLPHPS
jgi:hypothetical protein